MRNSSNTNRSIVYIVSTILASILSTIAIINFLSKSFLYPCIDNRINERLEPICEKINILFIYNREIAKSDSVYKAIWNNAVKEVKNDLTIK